VAILGLVWIVVGRGIGEDAVAAAARSVTFGDAAAAHLPNDARRGFVLFPAGPFTFGRSPAVAGVAAAGPGAAGQLITLGHLLVAKYEVTVAQYRQCADEGGCRPADPRALEGPGEWPVRYVTWFEAREYCAWLQRKLPQIDAWLLGQAGSDAYVALPSEPEWERASVERGAEGYPWRGPLAPARANYAGSGRLGPVQVGEFTAGATATGIHDLAGNVAEWTRSEFRDYPYDAADGREDGDSESAPRVIRGGSFYDDASLLTMTARQAADPARGYEFVGFRVVITRILPRLRSQPDIQQTAPAAPPATGQ
jgi:formylglycine-generating enzyme required for sulfatase activity